MADNNRITVTVNAGEHNRDGCPISVDVDNREAERLAGGFSYSYGSGERRSHPR